MTLGMPSSNLMDMIGKGASSKFERIATQIQWVEEEEEEEEASLLVAATGVVTVAEVVLGDAADLAVVEALEVATAGAEATQEVGMLVEAASGPWLAALA